MNKRLLIAIVLLVCSSSVLFGQANYGFELISRAVPGESETVFAVDNLCYVGAGNTLQILDVTDPASPILQGQFALRTLIEDVYIKDGLAYIANDDDGLIIADINLPSQTEILSRMQFSDGAFGIYVDGNYAYVTAVNAGFNIVDISDPYHPALRSTFMVDWAALNVDVQDSIACIACGYGGLYIMNISDPEFPYQTGLIDTHNTWAYDVKIEGDYAYMAYSLYDGGGGLKVVNISNPYVPYVEGDYSAGTEIRRIDYSTECVFAASRFGGMTVIDVADPGNPHPIGGYPHAYAKNIAYCNDNIFLSCGEDGLMIFNAPDLHFPTLVCEYPTFSSCYDVTAAGDYVYVSEKPSGLIAIDISNPTTPMVTYSHNFYFEDGEYGGISPSVSVVDDKLYIPSYRDYLGGDHDFRVYGLENPAQPESLGIYNDLNMGPRGHVVIDDIAYLGNSGTLKILDVRNPDNIELINSFYGDWDSAYRMEMVGDTMYLATMETGLCILDISNSGWPVEIGGFETEGEAFAAAYYDNHVYLADWDQCLRIINVENPEAPYEVGSYGVGLYEDCVNVAIMDDRTDPYAIVCFDDEVVALDITDPANPIEVGYYYTRDPRGLFIQGDTVYVADRDYGLYVLKLFGHVDVPESEAAELPNDIFLAQNYPNPFNSSTIIKFIMPEEGLVSVDVFDIAGRKITSVFNGNAQSGTNSVIWDGKDNSGQMAASGVYFYRITAAGKTSAKRMTFVK
ncbi:MAG: T9SS type A sorting domain-containing protein [candidate division Zixibacteria bacterium]|nr:T9SS type A sorting domain-containing protein [candidate division Zixibacteria bacterium]